MKINKKPALEKDIQKVITAWLKFKQIPVSVTDASRSFAKNGSPRKSKVDVSHPDLTCVLPIVVGGIPIGLAMYIEVKRPQGSIREGQKTKLVELANAGALCLLARSVDDVMPIVSRFYKKEFDVVAFEEVRKLLILNLSDRRSSVVKEGLRNIQL